MSQEINPGNIELSTFKEYAVVAKKSISTVYTDVSTGRSLHPPIYRSTPTARPLFVNVRAWLAEQVQLSLAGVEQPAPTSPPPATQTPATHLKKRGRPSNLARRASTKKVGAVC